MSAIAPPIHLLIVNRDVIVTLKLSKLLMGPVEPLRRELILQQLASTLEERSFPSPRRSSTPA